MLKKDKIKKQEGLGFLFAFVFCASAVFLCAPYDADLHHDGLMLKLALEMVQNHKIPYRDLLSIYNLLTLLINASFVKLGAIFGIAPLLSLKYGVSLFYGASGSLCFLLWKKLLKSAPLALFLSCLWILLAPYYFWTLFPWASSYALTFQLAGTLALFKFIEEKKISLIIVSGFFFSLVFWCRQPVGITTFFAVILFFSIAEWKQHHLDTLSKIVRWMIRFLALQLGAFLGSLPFVMYLQKHQALQNWYEQAIKLALLLPQHISENMFGRHTLWGKLTYFAKCFVMIPFGWQWVLLPFVATFFFAKIVLRNTSLEKKLTNEEQILLAYGLIALSACHQYYPAPCYRHYFWGGSMLLPFLPLVLEFLNARYAVGIHARSLSKSRPALNFTPDRMAIVLLCLFTPSLAFRLNGFIERHRQLTSSSQLSSLQGMKLSPAFLETLKTVETTLNEIREKYPEREILYLGQDAFWSTLIPNPPHFQNRFFIYWEGAALVYPEYTEALTHYLKQYRPIVIFQDQDRLKKFGVDESSTAAPIDSQSRPRSRTILFGDHFIQYLF